MKTLRRCGWSPHDKLAPSKRVERPVIAQAITLQSESVRITVIGSAFQRVGSKTKIRRAVFPSKYEAFQTNLLRKLMTITAPMSVSRGSAGLPGKVTVPIDLL